MPRSHEEIIKEASERPNDKTRGKGRLRRSDILEALKSVELKEPAEKEQAIADFVEKCQFLNERMRRRIVDDWRNY